MTPGIRKGKRGRALWLVLASMTSVIVAPYAAAQSTDPRAVAHDTPPVTNTRRAEEMLARPVTVDLIGVTRSHAVRAVAAEAKVLVQYQTDLLDAYTDRVTVRAKNLPLRAVLGRILTGTTLSVVAEPTGRIGIVDRVARTSDLSLATGTIVGRVVDSATERGVARVSVSLAGHGAAAMTGESGDFVLRDVPAGRHALTAKLLGYRQVTRDVVVEEGQQAAVRLVLSPTATVLSGVVTTATGTQDRIKVGNDIVKINVPEVLKNAPVATVSELLTNRVPGLIVQRTSGAAGAPSVIRSRGSSSISLNNDPIIVVDGVRVYSTISDARDGSIVPGGLAPSALDGIDPNSIESIEVMRGPSAAALWGTDAANGIIVIKTKRGQSGPARWDLSTTQGVSWLPGSYPLLHRLWGKDAAGQELHCTLQVLGDRGTDQCTEFDSLQTWQLLNDDRTTLFDRGANQSYSVGVNGGSASVLYAFTLSTTNTLGYAKMPDSEVERLERVTGNALPFWQRRPDGAATANGTSRVSVNLTPEANVALTSTIGRQTTRKTPLIGAITGILQNPDPSDSLLTLARVPTYRMKGETQTLTSTLGLQANWSPRGLITMSGNLGWNRISRNDESLLRRGDCTTCIPSSVDSRGIYENAKGTSDVISADVLASLNLLSTRVVSGLTTVGMQYTRKSNDDISVRGQGLPVGGTSFVGAEVVTTSGSGSDARVAGASITQGLTVFDRWSTNVGMRFDRGSGIGPRATLPTYPKLDFSIPILTDGKAWRGINTLRVRAAYGHSGKQPDIGARLRTFGQKGTAFAGSVPALDLLTIGNSRLRPERKVELEGGFDLGVWNDRIEFIVTAYRTMTRDLLIPVTVPTSVYGVGVSQQRNIGNVLNYGLNGTVTARVVETPNVRWEVQGYLDTDRQRLVSFAKDMATTGSVLTSGAIGGEGLHVEGYPLNGYWRRPIAAYSDANGDGKLSLNEIRLADSAVFLGTQLPEFKGAFGTSLGVFRGRVNVNALFSVQHGMVQANNAWLGDNIATVQFWQSLNDTTTPLETQARILDRSAFIKRVSSVRWEELSIRLIATPRIAQVLRFRDASVSIQARNLRLWTNYSGKDPNVRGRGETPTGDTGQLPPPRLWQLRVDLKR